MRCRPARSAFLLALASIAAVGCSPSEPGTAAPPAETPAAKPGAGEGGMAGMALELPAGWTALVHGDRTDYVNREGLHFSVWALPAGTGTDAAIAGLSASMVDVVTDFQPSAPSDATVAGAPAKLVTGDCVETDDGDPSHADVFVAQLGGRVRVVCVHGEGEATERLRPIALELLSAAKPEGGPR